MDAGVEEVDRQFAEEVARLRAAGVFGESGRLLELFDFLAARGPDAGSVSQADIAETVFGQSGSDGDDTTARVYVHRLRKRLSDYYDREENADEAGCLIVPSGTYALRFLPRDDARPEPRSAAGRFRRAALWLAIPLLLLALGLAAWMSRTAPGSVATGAIWRPLMESDRPIMIVLGDYYIFGEYGSPYPEVTRLVREFEINSPTDLARLQESDPARYAQTEDMGLNYLPFSSAYGLSAVTPVLAEHAQPVSVMPASQLSSDTFRKYNIVYIGLVSGMGLIEQVTFSGSSFRVGDNYDELVEIESETTYRSEEGYSLATPRYYRDYGYFSVFREPGGATVMVIAGARDTGLRGMSSLVSSQEFAEEVDAFPVATSGKHFEAVVEIVGQQGTDLKHRIVAARNRPGSMPDRR